MSWGMTNSSVLKHFMGFQSESRRLEQNQQAIWNWKLSVLLNRGWKAFHKSFDIWKLSAFRIGLFFEHFSEKKCNKVIFQEIRKSKKEDNSWFWWMTYPRIKLLRIKLVSTSYHKKNNFKNKLQLTLCVMYVSGAI